MRATDTLRSFRNRNFRLFFWGQAMSQNGTWMQLVAIDILVLRLTDSGVAVGLATAARFAPILVLGAWAGVLADRIDRQRLLLVLNATGGAVATVFAITVATGTRSLFWIFTLATASGIVTALESPTRRAFVADLVDDEDLPNAVGLNSAMIQGAKAIGPSLAGVVIATAGTSWCFALNAFSFLPQVLLVLRIDRSRLRPRDLVVRARGQLREGVRYAWSVPELRRPLLMTSAIGTLTLNYPVVLPLLATRDLDGGPSTYTTLLTAMSVGSVIGALGAARRREIETRFLARASLGLAIASFALAMAPNAVVGVALAVPVGIGSMLVIAGATTVVQLTAVPAMRGRILGLLTVVLVGTIPVGAPLAGWFGEHLGARAAISMGAATALVAGALTLIAQRRADRVSHTTPPVMHDTGAVPISIPAVDGIAE